MWVGALAKWASRPDVVGERFGCFCGVRDMAKPVEAHHLGGIDERGRKEPGRGGCGGVRGRRVLQGAVRQVACREGVSNLLCGPIRRGAGNYTPPVRGPTSG